MEIVDLPFSQRIQDKNCSSCGKPNPDGDLMCHACYKFEEEAHEKEWERVRKETKTR